MPSVQAEGLPPTFASHHAPSGEVPPPSSTEAVEKMRAENRERKKRWRENNEERNKDNDLRCRVNKRANKLYGEAPSEVKARWVEDEFQRRRSRRMSKETKRHLSPERGSDHLPTSPITGPLTPDSSVPTTPLPSLAHHAHAVLPPLHLPPPGLPVTAAPGCSPTTLPPPRFRPYDRHSVARDFWKIITDLKSELSAGNSPVPGASTCTSPVTRPTLLPELDRSVSHPAWRPQAPDAPELRQLISDLSASQIKSEPASPRGRPTLNLTSGLITPASAVGSPRLPPISTVFSACASGPPPPAYRSSSPAAYCSSGATSGATSPHRSPTTYRRGPTSSAPVLPPLHALAGATRSPVNSPGHDPDAVLSLVSLREITWA
ncbi:hypothetical protein IWQ60_005351 [Tieghemiomyces parasiticus]|uniref:DUF3020 domain-containing protein n=1 Tax=Tieghemiomyces parasiticus TaxID=78921 RepID=A0A9W8A9U1_9FUNG|nr:hypothetical protein IWQ60_005351 [Tieghemiomyces parasiticus]